MTNNRIHSLPSQRLSLSTIGPFLTLFTVWLALFSTFSNLAAEELRLYDLAHKKEVALSEALPGIRKSRVILIGEKHDRESHHRFQLEVIKALHATGEPLAIGLEMFQAESQQALDDWVGGRSFNRPRDSWPGWKANTDRATRHAMRS